MIEPFKSVTVSVWNDFHSAHLVNGLFLSGFDVFYHNTARKGASCTKFIRNYEAAALNSLARRGFFPQPCTHNLSRKLVDRTAKQLARQTDAFWGWSGCSLMGLQNAQASGKPALLERGSTHCLWNYETLKREYRRLNLSLKYLPSRKEISYEQAEYEASSAICIPSRFVQETFLLKGFPKEKLFVNPYGVDFSFWAQASLGRVWQPPFTFIWAASLLPRKGISFLLDGWQKAGLQNARLLLVGPISRLVEPMLRGLPPEIKVLNAMDHRAIREEMAKAHAYILPSLEEGMARSVLEAAAAGLAPIITRETGATDIFENGRDSWEIPCGSADAIAEILKSVSSSFDEAIRRGKNAARAVEPYSWDAYGRRAGMFLRSLF